MRTIHLFSLDPEKKISVPVAPHLLNPALVVFLIMLSNKDNVIFEGMGAVSSESFKKGRWVYKGW